jgi:hypothetical protein
VTYAIPIKPHYRDLFATKDDASKWLYKEIINKIFSYNIQNEKTNSRSQASPQPDDAKKATTTTTTTTNAGR